MLIPVCDAHYLEHTPRLIIDNPDSFRITDAETIEGPNLYCPELSNTYTRIHFIYHDTAYYVTDEPSPKLCYKGVEEGCYILLYRKDSGEYKLLDYVFDSFTCLDRIKQQKLPLLVRLTDIKLLGGWAEPKVEQFHKDLEELDKQRKLLREKLYP